MKIEIGKIGIIQNGSNRGIFVKVLDDGDCTGGYLIVTSSNRSFAEGFDDWVADSESLKAYFSEAGWIVVWQDPEAGALGGN